MSKAAAKTATSAPAPSNAPAPAAPEHKFRFAIEDNVPMPTKRIGPKGETGYPYAALAIGQSFFVPCSDTMKEPWKTMTSMSSRENRAQYPKQFTTARTKDANGVEGVRIWRKADAIGEQKPPRKLNRKPKNGAGVDDSKAAQDAEQIAGDTSQRQHPAPDFIDANDPPPPPPPVA